MRYGSLSPFLRPQVLFTTNEPQSYVFGGRNHPLHINSQKSILTRYAADHGFTNTRILVDDGYTGTNFNRPGVQEGLSLVEQGLVGTWIVKDMSRFGRDYLQVGRFTEIVFPSYDVRFIAVNDAVDSAKGDNDFTVIRNVFKNKCRLLVGNTFSPKFRQGYIFSHNQTNKPIEHLNILVALTVYNGTLTDFNMVNQFVNDGPV